MDDAGECQTTDLRDRRSSRPRGSTGPLLSLPTPKRRKRKTDTPTPPVMEQSPGVPSSSAKADQGGQERAVEGPVTGSEEPSSAEERTSSHSFAEGSVASPSLEHQQSAEEFSSFSDPSAALVNNRFVGSHSTFKLFLFSYVECLKKNFQYFYLAMWNVGKKN